MSLTDLRGPEAQAPEGRRSARRAWWMVPPLVLLLLGGWLVSRDHGLWYDELYTAEVTPLPPGELVDAVVSGEGTIPYLRDAPPSYNAPYYLVTHLWVGATPFGADETGLRVLSLLATAAAIAALAAAVDTFAGARAAPSERGSGARAAPSERGSGARAGFAAGMIAATNPFVVEFAGEARGYGLAMLATALAGLGLARWLDGRPRSLLLYGVAGAAAGLFHWYSLLVLVAFALAAVVLRRRRAVGLVAVTGAAAIPALGLLGIAVANGVGSSGAEWIGDVGGAVPRLLLRSWASGSVVLMVVTVVAAAAGLLARGPDRAGGRTARVVAGLWIGVPVALVLLLQLVRPVFVARYLLPATLGLAALMALGVTRLPRRLAAAALALTTGVSLLVTVDDIGRGPREDVRGAVAAVASTHRAGEPVVAAARWDALGLDHYARHDHPELEPDLVLPPAVVPPATRVWVVRRATAGVKGDPARLDALDTELSRRGLRVADERRYDGRMADVVVQRWEPA